MKFIEDRESKSGTYRRWNSDNHLYTIAWYHFRCDNGKVSVEPHFTPYYLSAYAADRKGYKTMDEAIKVCWDHQKMRVASHG